MQHSLLLPLGLLACMLVACQAQRAEQLLAQNPCSSKMTCSDCIRTASCAWCFQADFKEPRCFNPALESGTGGCAEEFIYDPDNERIIDTKDNRELSRGGRRGYSESAYEETKGGSGSYGAAGAAGGFAGEAGAAGAAADELVQVKPQRVTLKLRMHQMQKLDVAYSQAQDYPIDLYYLMDLSRSMKNDRDKLSTLGTQLSSTMRNITSNFRIGYGSFVDKVVMPYVSTVPKNLEKPCDFCAAPYGYKNQMSLSKDTDFFNEAVAKAEVSGNLDAPEGGFDAIMQAIVCREQIGWREQARRLLVFSSDAGFHYAGDGKLGGIVQPNDGQCHMQNDIYTHSTLQDYPSISQINLKARENAMNLIFAVTSSQISVYEELSKHIEGSSSGVLSGNSDNVVELVKQQYDKISSTVEMRDNSSNAVQVVYYSSCLGNKNDVIQTNKCDGLKVGDVVQFTAEITLKECPKDPREWKQVFQIHPVGISESLTVQLDMLCDCPCEHPGHYAYERNAAVCHGYGELACGVCVCEPGRFGKACECSAGGGGGADQERGCRPRNNTSGPLCSNRGTCFCGQCTCNKMDDPTKVISGTYCECDNFTCDMNKGQICSGPENGVCECGACKCTKDFTGPACQCPKSQEPCRSRVNGKICSGNGVCVCGKCVCNVKDEQKYFGDYCENCPSCTGKCKEFKDCVLCEVHQRGPMWQPDAPAGEQCGNCTLQPIVEEGKIIANESKGEYLCSFYDDEDCLYVFVYSYSIMQHLTVRAQKDRECPPKVFILGIVLGVIAAIVLVGLALLMLWKMVTTIHDRREFARFEKERLMAKWDTGENPIYKQATSTFKNPTYAGK